MINKILRMSNIDKKTIEKVARLANIKVSEAEKDILCDQLGKITNFVDLLQEVDTDNVEIMGNVHNINLKLFEDEVKVSNSTEEVLQNAPDAQYNYFAVPKVIE